MAGRGRSSDYEGPHHVIGDYGTAGYNPDDNQVWIDGVKYNQTGTPWGTYDKMQGHLFQGRPYSDYAFYDPTYGNVARADAIEDAARFNGKHWTDFGPALFAGGMFAGPIAASLSSLGGLGASLGMPHGGAFELASGLGSAGGGGAGGFLGEGVSEAFGGSAGPDVTSIPGSTGTGGPFAEGINSFSQLPSATPPLSTPTSGLEQLMSSASAGQPLITGGLGTSAQMVSIAEALGIPASQLAQMGVTGLGSMAPTNVLGGMANSMPTSMAPPGSPGSSNQTSDFWDSIFNPKGPVMGGLGALGELLGKREQANSYEEIMRNAQSMFDPFSSERDKYKQLLSRSYLDPTYFDQDSTLANLDKRTTREMERYLAGKGFSNSGNLGLGIGEALGENRAKYALSHQNQLAQLAGAGISPATAAQAYTQGATLGSGARQGQYAAAGNLLQNLPGILNTAKGMFG